MDLPSYPDDREKKLKGLMAGERGRGFAEVISDAQASLAPRIPVPPRRKPRSKRRGKKTP